MHVFPDKKFVPEQEVQVEGVVEHVRHGDVHRGHEGGCAALPTLQVRQFKLFPSLQVAHLESHYKHVFASWACQPAPQGFAHTFPLVLKPPPVLQPVQEEELHPVQPGGHSLQMLPGIS